MIYLEPYLSLDKYIHVSLNKIRYMTSSIYYVSLKPRQSSPESEKIDGSVDPGNEVQNLLNQGKYKKISSKYKKYWSYIFSAFCQAKTISDSNKELLDLMSYSLSTSTGRRMLKEFPQHYDPKLRVLKAKSISYGPEDFALDPNLENLLEDTPVCEELEFNIDFLKAGFRKGWTKYLIYSQFCVQTLLSVLEDPTVDSKPFLDYLTPVKKMSHILNLSLTEYDLLHKLLPDVHPPPDFNSAYNAYLLGIYDIYLNLEGTDYDKLNHLVVRSMISARSDKLNWWLRIVKKNIVSLETIREEFSFLYGTETEEIVKNKEDVLGEEVIGYQPFDHCYYTTVSGLIYLFTRPEYESIISKNENLYTREQMAPNLVNKMDWVSKHSKYVGLPDARPLSTLIRDLPVAKDVDEVLKDELIVNSVSKDRLEENILQFMYGNYAIWTDIYLNMSSTIYSYLYRCFRYWTFLRSIEPNYIISVRLNIVSKVQQKFPQMTDIACVNFIISNKELAESSLDNIHGYIDFCANWNRFYHPRNRYAEYSFVQNCHTILEKKLHR